MIHCYSAVELISLSFIGSDINFGWPETHSHSTLKDEIFLGEAPQTSLQMEGAPLPHPPQRLWRYSFAPERSEGAPQAALR